MAYNYLELVNDVNRRLNEVELSSSTFSASTGFYSFAKNAVNAAIRQVDEFIVHIFLFEAEFMGAESDEPFLVNENCQRRDAGYQNVET